MLIQKTNMFADYIVSRICPQAENISNCELENNLEEHKACNALLSKERAMEQNNKEQHFKQTETAPSLENETVKTNDSSERNLNKHQAIVNLMAEDFKLDLSNYKASDISINLLAQLGCGVISFNIKQTEDSFTYKLLWANDVYYSMLGYDRESFAFDNVFDKIKLLVHTDDIVTFNNYYGMRNKTKNPLRVQYRLLHRSGRYIWVDVKSVFIEELEDGSRSFISMLSDITAEHKLEETLDNASRKAKVAKEFNDQLIFEYDRNTDSLYRIGSSINSKIHGLQSNVLISSHFLKSDIYRGFICSEDVSLISDLLLNKTLVNSDKPEEVNFRVLNREHEYIYHTCTAMAYVDPYSNHVIVLGKIQNNHHAIMRLNQLKSDQKLDVDTNLFNELSMVRRCRALLSLEGDISHALIVVEIDRFEYLESSYGKVFAKDVLSTIAKSLTDSFRKSDYIAHIEGKRFAVMAKDCNEETAIRLCNKLIEGIAIDCSELAYNYKPSLSMGIAVYPDAAWNFDGLRSAAIVALEDGQRKQQKGSISVYRCSDSEENRHIALQNFSEFEKMMDETDICEDPLKIAQASINAAAAAIKNTDADGIDVENVG